MYVILLVGCLVVVAATACYFAWLARNDAAVCAKWIEQNNAKSKSLSEIARLSADLTELDDAYHALLDSHKKLRSRIGMREIRERRKKGNGEDTHVHDATTDKEVLRERARAKGFKL